MNTVATLKAWREDEGRLEGYHQECVREELASENRSFERFQVAAGNLLAVQGSKRFYTMPAELENVDGWPITLPSTAPENYQAGSTPTRTEKSAVMIRK